MSVRVSVSEPVNLHRYTEDVTMMRTDTYTLEVGCHVLNELPNPLGHPDDVWLVTTAESENEEIYRFGLSKRFLVKNGLKIVEQ